MMKKVLCLLILMMLLSVNCFAADTLRHAPNMYVDWNGGYKIGDSVGFSLTTDIAAQINGYDIPSYNYGGYIYVIVEDLANYGFNVIYNNDTRSLHITRDYGTSRVFSTYRKPEIASRSIGTRAFDILYTDIRTYVDGRYVNSYNIDGRTIIAFDELAPYGTYTWDDVARKITLDIAGIKNRPYTPVPTTGYINVHYNGSGLFYGNEAAFFYNGEIMVPFERTFKLAEMAEDWMEFWNDGEINYFTGGDCSFAFVEGDNTAYIYWSNGTSKSFYMNVAPMRKNGILFIPLRTYCEMTDKVMSWNDSCTAIYLKNSFDTDLSPDEARDLLEYGIGDLGAWQDGKENYLSFNSEQYVNGKVYYQYILKGWVENHATTLTWYVVSSDGSDIFEGMCIHGNLERWKTILH